MSKASGNASNPPPGQPSHTELREENVALRTANREIGEIKATLTHVERDVSEIRADVRKLNDLSVQMKTAIFVGGGVAAVLFSVFAGLFIWMNGGQMNALRDSIQTLSEKTAAAESR
jgi:prefoldin subunit 5